MNPSDLNSALFGALIAAGIAALGYIGKLAVTAWQGWRAEKRRRLARLLELNALLSATDAVFKTILRLTHELEEYLLKQHPDADTAGGFERLFSEFFSTFDAHASDLHTIIRGYTAEGQASLNSQLLAWLRADVTERWPRRPTPAEAEMAFGLRELDRHLVLWTAKLPVWISDDHPDHCLCFLDDEQKHGHRFPPGLDRLVADVLTARGIKVYAEGPRNRAVVATSRPGDSPGRP